MRVYIYTLLTAKYVILVILVGLAADLDETRQSVILHELVHQVLVLLKRDKAERAL